MNWKAELSKFKHFAEFSLDNICPGKVFKGANYFPRKTYKFRVYPDGRVYSLIPFGFDHYFKPVDTKLMMEPDRNRIWSRALQVFTQKGLLK